MRLENAIGDIEACVSLDALKDKLHCICQNYGFAAFNFLDVGGPHRDVPFHLGSMSPAFANDYFGNGLIHVDPCISQTRRSNLPFAWSEVKFPRNLGIRRSGAQITQDVAAGHGYTEGLIVPFHFADGLGRVYSSLIVFFWRDKVSAFDASLRETRHELHIVMLYWAQRAVALMREDQRHSELWGTTSQLDMRLTDREREVLAWASRGKTSADTAEILGLSQMTVNTHMRHALQKLGAVNKPHAVARAIFLGLIDG